jgi:hypothetical protein
MARPKKNNDEQIMDQNVEQEEKKIPSIHDIEWTDYVLSLLTDDEKIMGNPTTDGLRRIFENVLDCIIVEAKSEVVQTPDIGNEKRATVVHTVSYSLKESYSERPDLNYRSVSGSADVYWGNCDKVYRNHPVAVAETRAEGRALRRALRLRKVVAAEELAKDIEDHPDHDTVNKITNNQINFIDVLSKRMDINVSKLIEKLAPETKNIYNIEYENAVHIVQNLTTFQQSNNIPEELKGYSSEWK